ncbi:hypothetical protein EDD18DRAFT_1109971 [Armillaria luteobubalina]|uniref:Uncharacterized protein n=1 Tax=Armillaria luteobubalina TaxID=153913 RepID=A0AA39THZ8_9AGAR|nr:hypothetical protein EDD18DRAFT_1109971 [Armillaria luteobubalina]
MQWITAKGEAEAELARLNQLGIIDACTSSVAYCNPPETLLVQQFNIVISAPSQASSTMIPRTIESNYDLTFTGGVTAMCIIAGHLSKADPNLKIFILTRPITKDKSEHVQPGQYIIHLAPTSRAVVIPSGRCIGGDCLTNVALH